MADDPADIDEPVQGDETAEEFSDAWLGRGPRTTYAPPDAAALWRGFGWGFFFGSLAGGLVATVAWLLLG